MLVKDFYDKYKKNWVSGVLCYSCREYDGFRYINVAGKFGGNWLDVRQTWCKSRRCKSATSPSMGIVSLGKGVYREVESEGS